MNPNKFGGGETQTGVDFGGGASPRQTGNQFGEEVNLSPNLGVFGALGEGEGGEGLRVCLWETLEEVSVVSREASQRPPKGRPRGGFRGGWVWGGGGFWRIATRRSREC